MSGPGSLEDALSHERFGRYMAWAGGDRDRALELYALNIRVSEALYPPLQMLEVVLRNRIHTVLSEARQPAWFTEDGYPDRAASGGSDRHGHRGTAAGEERADPGRSFLR